MYLDPMEMCRAEKPNNKMCVKYMQLPWNIPMVAAINGTTENIVKEGLRERHSLIRQLKHPYAKNTNRDLNKRSDTPIAIIAGVPVSWRFLDYIVYMGDKSAFETSSSKPRDRYHYYLKQNKLHNTTTTLVDWFIYYARKHNSRVEASIMTAQGETLSEAIKSMYNAYQKFDKNKLRKRGNGYSLNITPPEDPDLRIQYILKRYIDVIHLLPSEHVRDAVETMLKYKDIEWLPQETY